jgi:hypothetical protein
MPLSTIKHLRSNGGGAFFTQFVKYLIGKGPCSVLDFQRNYNSFVRRVSVKRIVKYYNYWESNIPDEYVIPCKSEYYDYIVAYHMAAVLVDPTMSQCLFKRVVGNTQAFVFYFDPFVASRCKADNCDFRFIKRDDNKVHYDIGGTSYVDPFISKRNILDKWGGEYLIDFLSLAQLDKKLDIGLANYMKHQRGVINHFMYKCVRVVHIKAGNTSVIAPFGKPQEFEAYRCGASSLTGSVTRPFMLTIDRINHVQSDMCWVANKADGYQAVIDIPKVKSRFDPEYNAYIHFRNGVSYKAKIPYKGFPIRLQVTVIGDIKSFGDVIKVDRMYYEDVIRIENMTNTTFSRRAIIAEQAYRSGLPIIMKRWEIYDSSLVQQSDSVDSEGIIFQFENVYRYGSGYVSEGRPCYYLVKEYSIDVSVYDNDKFDLDGVQYVINEGKAPVREVIFDFWFPPKFRFVRDRWDRASQFFSHSGSDKNSMKLGFVSDYKDAVSIDQFNCFVASKVRLCGKALMLYGYFLLGKSLTTVSADHYDGIRELVVTGHSKLYPDTGDDEVHEGFYVWREYFQRSKFNSITDKVKLEDLFPAPKNSNMSVDSSLESKIEF